MIAAVRVISRRSQGRMRKFKNPFHYYLTRHCSGEVDDWPEHSSATANRIPAMVVPSSGASNWFACWICVTTMPRLKNTITASTRMAGVHSSAPFKRDGGVDQIVLARSALFVFALADAAVCTSAECR